MIQQKKSINKRIQRLSQSNFFDYKNHSASLVILLLVMGSLTFFAFQNIRRQPIVSIAGDNMNIFYFGADNPITIAVEGILNKNVTVSSEDIELTNLGNGRYSVKPLKLGTATIIVEANNQKREMPFVVKTIPDPKPYGKLKDGKKIINGDVTAEQMKSLVRIEVEKNELYDVDCEVIKYELTRVPKENDPITERNYSGEFKGRAKILKDLAQTGDAYYIDEIKAKCPGDEKARSLEGMVFKIK